MGNGLFGRRFQKAPRRRVLAQGPLPLLSSISLSHRGCFLSTSVPLKLPCSGLGCVALLWLPNHISPNCSSRQWDWQSSGSRVSPQTYPPRSHISERRPEETQLEVQSAAGAPTALTRTSSASVHFLLVPLAQGFGAWLGLTLSSELSSFVLGCGKPARCHPETVWTALSVNRGHGDLFKSQLPTSQIGGPWAVT